MEVRRLGDGPLIGPASDPSLGTNIQGPSLVRAPSWIDDPLGRFYLAELAGLYGALFGEGSFARTLASDAVTPHIASPDVHVDEAERRVVMYFHGLDGLGIQVSRAAVSSNGIDFVARPEVLVLHVFWSRVGDAPERILRSTIRLDADWTEWSESAPVEVLRPVHPWEGADAPVEPSARSVAPGRVNQVRDPAVFDDGDRLFLLDAVAGESGIAIAELETGAE